MPSSPGHSISLLDHSFDGFPDLLFLVNRKGVILDYRGGRDARLYAPPDAFLGRSLNAVLPPSVSTRLEAAVARVSDRQGPESVDYTLSFPDGEREFEARLVPMAPEAVLAVCRDITETPRKYGQLDPERQVAVTTPTELRPEPVHQLSDRRYRQLEESIDRVSWLLDVGAERMRHVSPSFASIFGRPTDELYADPRLWMRAIHPDDRRYANARYEAWFGGGATAAGSLSYRIVRPDGTIRWLLDTVTVFGDDSGSVRQVGGVAADVTTQRSVVLEVNDALSLIIGDTQVARRLAGSDRSLTESLDRALTAARTVEILVRRMTPLAWPAPNGSLTNPGPLVAEAAGLLQQRSALATPDPLPDDWRLMLSNTRPNMLIEGPATAADAALSRLLPHCVEPVIEWSDALGDTRPATLIVRDAANLSASDQRRLMRWMEGEQSSQVLSTTERPLFPLVADGQFLATLFYRLNVVRLDV